MLTPDFDSFDGRVAFIQHKVRDMTDTSGERKISWEAPLVVAGTTGILLTALIIYTPYSDVLFVFFIGPVTTLIFLVLLVICAIRRKPSQCSSLLLALLAFFVISGALLWNQSMLRDHARWLVRSHNFKAAVLAQPTQGNGELKHIEWEATGFATIDNTAYLVFDPSDSLSSARLPGDINGIPCRVLSARRLERGWYSVRFYTDVVWGDCPSTPSSAH